MTVSCCWECRKVLTYRGGAEQSDWSDGHWYGCSYCGRDVCTACALQCGRRCDRCGRRLESDRKFPLRLLADGDWRDHLPRVDPEYGIESRNERLVVYATPERVHAILDAIPSAAAVEFWADILEWEVRRRLGTLDWILYLPDPEIRLDDDWRAKLGRVAAVGLAARGGFDEAAVALCERIEGWCELELPAAGILAQLEQALDDGRKEIVRVALRSLGKLSLTRAELLRVAAPRLASVDHEARGVGLRALLSALNETGHEPSGPIGPAAVAVVVEALPRIVEESGAEWVVDRLMQVRQFGPTGPTMLCRSLRLGDALVEGLADRLVPSHPRFTRVFWEIAELLPAEHPAVREAERVLAEGGLSRSKVTELHNALAEIADAHEFDHDSCETDSDGEDPDEEDPDEEDPDEEDPRLVEQIERALTVEGLRQQLDPWIAASPHYAAELDRLRPRLLLEVQRELAGEGYSWRCASLMTALGRLRVSPGDGPEALLLDRLERVDEPACVRLEAARTLSKRPIAEHHRDRLLALTTDPLPIIRAWTLRLVDDPDRWAAAADDSSEIVRHLVCEHRRQHA